MRNGKNRGNFEKPKDFKSAIIRLIKELKDFRILVLTALILAFAGSILAIMTPDKLSNLTDEIAKGIMVDKELIEKLQKNIEINSTITKDRIEFNDFTMNGTLVTKKDQMELANIMKDVNDKNDLIGKLEDLPLSVQKIITPLMDNHKIRNIALFILGLYIISALFNYVESLIMTIVSNKFARKLRSDIENKLNKLPLKFFDKTMHGDILSRMTNDVDTIAASMNNSLATLVSSVTLFLGCLFMMFHTNGLLALTAIFSSLFGFIFMALVLSKSQKYFVARQTELGNLNGHIEEVYSGLNIVKAYNGKKRADEIFDKYNRNVYDANRKSQFLSGLMMPMMGFIGNLGYVAVCIVGALLTMNGKISFGVIIAFITYVRMFANPLNQIAQALSSFQSVAAASERVFEVFDEEEMANEQDKNAYLNKKDVKGMIEFKNVKFKYDGNENDTIKGFSAIARPGEKVAIVGPTGAGKTTIVNLLMKFYEIDGGDILIDGVSTKNLTRENIHDLFTMVLQDTWLFDGTIKENLTFNGNNIPLDEIKEVCEKVGVDHFIKTLPNSYDSVISDNDNISGGQKQLITIARGMLKNSPFLILDEATSNVDTRTEELVQSAMDKLAEGKTSFIIAHRLSTIKNANLILVMNEGNIIEQGTHEELLQKGGFYAQIYNSQFTNN